MAAMTPPSSLTQNPRILDDPSDWQTEDVDFDPFADAVVERVVLSTEAQREVWLASELSAQASLAFNESVCLRIDGALDIAALRAALGALVARHDALRTRIGPDGGELIVHAAGDEPLPVLDLRRGDAAAREDGLSRAKADEVSTPFDLGHGPLFRARLVVLADDAHALLMTAHHIVCDGWSWGVIVRELGLLYDARVRAGATATDVAAAALSPAPRFGDYVAWEIARQREAAHAASERYWLGRFGGGTLPVLDLPSDRPRPAVRSFDSRRGDHVLDAALVAALRKQAGRLGVSYYGLMFGAFAVLLHRLSGQHDVVIGVPAAGQSASGLTGLVGHCVNLLPVRVGLDPAQSFEQFARDAGGQLLDAFEHQSLTYGSLLKKLPVQRDPSRLPLVSVMFNVDSAVDGEVPGFAGLAMRFASNPRLYENFELFVNATPVPGGAYRVEWQFNTGLFDDETIARWSRCYEALLRGLVARGADGSIGTTPLSRLELLGADDRAALHALQPAPLRYPRDCTMVADFVRQAAATPTRIAAEWRERSMTYAELDAASNRLARALRERGVGRGVRVGLCIERGFDMLVSVLAVLKAGGAYLPLDPAFPPARLDYYAQDAAIGLLLTDSTVAVAPREWRPDGAARTIDLDRDPSWRDGDASPLPSGPQDAGGEDPAYVIYTSGSTGRPKGVCVPHRAVVSFLAGMLESPGIEPDDRLAAVTTLSFDVSVLEMFLPLAVGARLIIVDRDTMMDGPALGALLDRSGATVMQATPTLWRLLLDAGWRAGRPFTAYVGGESLTPSLAGELLAAVDDVWNLYGPTETTVWVTVWKVDREQIRRRGVSIGRPIGNVCIWVLDENGQPCPIGVPGELYIGGDNLASGYVDRPELNAERFIADPMRRALADGAPLPADADARDRWLAGRSDAVWPPLVYRTGDRGRWTNDGLLDHLGRMDFQVKVRGFRIELGEIEATCNEAAGVARSVVLAREDRPGDVRLVAYLTLKPDGDYSESALREHLSGKLPEYMLPACFVVLDAIPTTSNGKVDRNALPAPDTRERTGSAERTAPRDEVEAAVLAATERVLSLPGIGIHDDFFALGGHSLLAARLIAQLNREFGTQLSLRVLFESPTVARLAAEVGRARGGEAARRPVLVADPTRRDAPTTVMQERVRFVEELLPGRSVYHEPSAHRLSGPFDRASFERALAIMFARQSVLRTAFGVDAQGAGVQRIASEVPVDLPFEDLRDVPADAREAELRRRMQAVIESPMDLTVAPLCHMRLYRLADDEHVFLFVPHHLIWDGWSFDLLYEEMAMAYQAIADGTIDELAPLPVSYADYAVWHRQFLQSDEYQRQLAYWKGRLLDAPVPQPWPASRSHRQSAHDVGGSEWVRVDKALTERLRELAREFDVTPSMLCLAVYAALTQRMAGDNAVAIGLPVRGRQMPEIESVMGFFNNLVTVQLPSRDDEPVRAFAARVRAEMLEVFGHQDVPFETLVKEPELMPRMQRAGLYQVMFSFQDARERKRRWGPLRHQNVLVHHQGASNDMGLWLMEVPTGLEGAVVYNASLFEREAAVRIREQYLRMLRRLAERPALTIGELIGGFRASDVAYKVDPPVDAAAVDTVAVDAVAVGTVAVGTEAGAADGETVDARVVDPAAGAPDERSVRAAPATPAAPADDVRTLTEQMLAEVWRKLLDVDPIERQDNFFDLGGNSLLAIQAVELIAARCGRRVAPGAFAFETLAQIARSIDDAPAGAGMGAGMSTGAVGGSRTPAAAPGGGVTAERKGGLLRKLGSVFRR
ncbi:MAG: amino acid adenylation domain-containing protein [Burkholderiaceae bacterium]